MQWRTAKMSWSPGSPPELAGEPQRCWFQRDFRVFGSVRKQADADRLQREFGEGFVPLMMDITDADAVHRAAEKVGSMMGDRNLMGLVNNAGIVVSGPLLHLRPSEYRRQLDVNMVSPLVVIQAFAPLLGTDRKRQGPAGRIVNITSAVQKFLSRFSARIAPPNLALKECRTCCGWN